MKYLSIRQPWAHLILNDVEYTRWAPCNRTTGELFPTPRHGKKDIENRTWKTTYRGQLLIHASKNVKLPECVTATQHDGNKLVSQVICADFGIREDIRGGGIVGVVNLIDIRNRDILSPWWEGNCYGWILAHAQPLPFSPLTGGLGLRDVSEKVLQPKTLAALREWQERNK